MSQDIELLPVQKSIHEGILSEWNRKKRHGVFCPKQPAVNQTLLYIAAQMGVPTLIFCSDVSRYSEWISQIEGLFGLDVDDAIGEFKLNEPLKPVNLTTYPAICNELNATPEQRSSARIYREYELASVGSWHQVNDNIGDWDAVKETEELLSEEAIRELTYYNSQLMRFIELEEDDLKDSGWLNKNVDQFIKKLSSEGLGLILFDDTHEVTGIWAESLYYFMQNFNDLHTISLTPLKVNLNELSARNFQLQTSLFTTKPYEVKLPLLVRDGCSRPYLGLMAITVPNEQERKFLESVNSTLRNVLNKVRDENQVSVTINDFVYSELEQMENDIPGNWSRRREYLESVLNFVEYYSLIPSPVWKIYIGKLEQPEFRKNLPVIRDYVFRCLISSHESREQKLGEQIIVAFRPLGFEIDENNIEQSTSLIPNILTRSAAKEELLVKHITEEFIHMKKNLRAVIVSDFIDYSSAEELFPGNDFDSSSSGMLSILSKLEGDPITLQLNPIVIYGNFIYFNPKFKNIMCKSVEKHAEEYDNILAKQKQVSGYCYIEVVGAKSFKSFWQPLINKILNNKISQCMVVSREFLSDKWDGINFNTFFNMSTATSKLFGVRMLARLLSIDKDDVPSKHLWDFCAIMPEIELGMSDYHRISERKQFGWHLCEDGEFEQGISYLHPSLKTHMSTMSLKLIEEINETSKRLIADRKRTAEMWMAKTDVNELVKEVLEIKMPDSFAPEEKYSINLYKGKTKTATKNIDGLKIIESICQCVVTAIKEIEQLREKPVNTAELSLSQRRKGIYRVEITGCNAESKTEILNIIKEIFAPVKHQHYVVTVSCSDSGQGIISKLFAEAEKHSIPFGVPEAFSKKEDLTLFLKAWRRMVSNDEMIGFRIPETKKKITAMLKNPKIDLRPECRICTLLV